MKNAKRLSWDFWAIAILLFYAVFQITRWPFFPQHLDAYYHLLTGWGFIKAGGYTNWDFWQYAPIGRPHVYPPLFHIVLAILMKAGMDKILLAKIFSAALPSLFLAVLWNFIRKNFHSRLAFFSLLTISSSLSFYMSFTNYMPSTVAMTFGVLAISQFMNKRFLRAIILFALCFYTHIGASWFLLSAVFIFSLTDKSTMRAGFVVSMAVLMLASPVLINQLLNLKAVHLDLINEKYFCEYKTLDYLLAALGFVFALRKGKKYLLFSAFFIASFIYIAYPFRFFSSEGYMAIALLAALSLDHFWEKWLKKIYLKIAVIFSVLFLLIFSPTIVVGDDALALPQYKLFVFDSAIVKMVFPEINKRTISQTLWFRDYYDDAVRIIQNNSSEDDIIYCTNEFVGVCLAAVAERATANHLLPEIYPSQARDPFVDSKIIIILKDNDPRWIKLIVEKYHLALIGENGIFYIYKNRGQCPKIRIKKAVVPFNLFSLAFN